MRNTKIKFSDIKGLKNFSYLEYANKKSFDFLKDNLQYITNYSSTTDKETVKYYVMEQKNKQRNKKNINVDGVVSIEFATPPPKDYPLTMGKNDKVITAYDFFGQTELIINSIKEYVETNKPDEYNIINNTDYNYDFELSNENLTNKYMNALQEIRELDLSLIQDDELKEMLTYVKENFDEDNATPEGLDILEKYLVGAKKEVEKNKPVQTLTKQGIEKLIKGLEISLKYSKDKPKIEKQIKGLKLSLKFIKPKTTSKLSQKEIDERTEKTIQGFIENEFPNY